jgi:hypothetical protein
MRSASGSKSIADCTLVYYKLRELITNYTELPIYAWDILLNQEDDEQNTVDKTQTIM